MPRDASELARRLARHAEAVCRYYLSNGRRQGRFRDGGEAAFDGLSQRSENASLVA